MIFYMDSETFLREFIPCEKDKTILKAKYVCVSTHIRRRDTNMENIITNAGLYPQSYVLNMGSFEDMKKIYFDQLDIYSGFIASLIKGAIEEDYNIIFICTKNEMKLKYMKWIAEYILLNFEYPVYNYNKYINGCGLIKYDKRRVHKIIRPIIKDAEENQLNNLRKSQRGQRIIMSDYKSKSKKELKKICKSEQLYYDGMTRKEMLDILEVFL